MKKIDNEFNNPITELENGWIQTPNGVFTPNETLGLNAYEVYEKYLYDLESPPTPKPTLEEIVEEQANKISILTDENKILKDCIISLANNDNTNVIRLLQSDIFKNL